MAPPVTTALMALPPRTPGGDDPPARYGLVLAAVQSLRGVETAVRTDLADLAPRVRPISPGVHDVLVLELPSRTLRHADSATAFTAGYALADHFGLSAAEPDLPTSFFPVVPVTEPPGGGRPDEALPFPGCFVDGEDLPPRWALDRLDVPAAWAYSESAARPTRGAGVVIAQPDTGVVRHAELDGVVRVGGWDVLDGDDDPTDPLDGPDPGHGTGTASVVVSPESLVVAGSAPAASHMPIRAVTSVVAIAQISVGEAVNRAVDDGAQIITMSLGGLPSGVLERAIQRAVAADVIVLAAAGNCVRVVVWPARYDDCIAVAATNAADEMWPGTCRGAAVDIAAPGQNVFRAAASDPAAGPDDTEATGVGQGQGTSFAVALIAGIAALWLAHRGRADLIAAARARGETLQAMFVRLVAATARQPDGWDSSELGAGIAGARALLAADLDAGRAPSPAGRSGVASLVAETIGPAAADDPDLDWVRYGPELAAVLLARQLAAPDRVARRTAVPVAVSADLARAVRNPRLRDHLGLDHGPGRLGALRPSRP